MASTGGHSYDRSAIRAGREDVMQDLVDIKSRKPVPTSSMVLATPPAASEAALSHFQRKLAVETDPSDVHSDLATGHDGFVVLDARPEEAYRRAHLPGAVSLPYREIGADTAALLGERTAVVYCWGPACNAAAKAAVRLARLGIPVKEMVGGIEYWRREGYPLVEGDDPGALQ
jgi:rhodanese-related sulfurtransferase